MLREDPERAPLLKKNDPTESNHISTGTFHDSCDGEIAHVNGNAIGDDNDNDKREISVQWQAEIKLITRHSIPLVGTYLLQYFYSLVIVLVASRLSTEELAGVSLGITTSNIIGYAVFEGMATALDTLCSQAYGAGQPKLVGLHCVRFAVYIHLVALPIAALWLFSPQLLRFVVPSRELAENAGVFLRYSLVGVPGYATFEAGKRFMQAQGNFTAGLIILLACLPLNIFFNWLLVFHFELRIAGAALAAALTHMVRPFMLVAYAVCFNPSTLQCWPSGLKLQSVWKGWGRMVRLSIPGALMTLSEWFSFEILTFATSYVSNVELAAQTYLSTAAVLLWHIPFSASVATSTRIGQLVGGGLHDTAKQLMAIHGWIFLFIGVLNAGLAVGLNALIVKYLSLDEDVSKAVASALVWVAMFCFFDSTSMWVHAIVRGLGWQKIGGLISVTVNYLYGVPLALGLLLGKPNMGVGGIFLALGSGLGFITVIEGLIVRARSWEKAADGIEEAQI